MLSRGGNTLFYGTQQSDMLHNVCHASLGRYRLRSDGRGEGLRQTGLVCNAEYSKNINAIKTSQRQQQQQQHNQQCETNCGKRKH